LQIDRLLIRPSSSVTVTSRMTALELLVTRLRHLGVTLAVSLAVLVPAAATSASTPTASLRARPAAAGPAAVWEASLEGVHGTSPNVTVREIARVSVDSSRIRVRLGNPFGATPLAVRDAWIGRPIAPGLAQLVSGSNRALTFGGARQLTLQPGESRLSDAVAMTVPAQQDVAVSLYAPNSPVNDHTFPPFQFDPPASYINTGGDTAADTSNASFPTTPVISGNTPSKASGYHPGQTWWMDLVVADRPAARGTLVTLGDSITDGYHADGPPGQRWTDLLAYRLDAVPAQDRLAVANAGISGNTVSNQPNPYDRTGQCCGPPALKRLQRDVLSVPGVSAVFLLEGTNDIGGGTNAASASASQVINAMTRIVSRAHDKHLPVIGATILPMCERAGSAQEKTRLAVNQWLRSSGTFDAVVDFDAVLRNPSNPTEMIPDLRHDCYHPNAAGDTLLTQAIPLWLFGVPVSGHTGGIHPGTHPVVTG